MFLSYLMCCKHIYFLLLNCISDYVRCKEWADLGRFVPTLLIKKVRHYKAQTWTHNARHPISKMNKKNKMKYNFDAHIHQLKCNKNWVMQYSEPMSRQLDTSLNITKYVVCQNRSISLLVAIIIIPSITQNTVYQSTFLLSIKII